MKKTFVTFASLLLLACGTTTTQTTETTTTKGNMALKKDSYELINTVRLTVAESKRLIAKGLYVNADVQDKLASGMIIITRGSTNTYIAEEFVNLDKPRGAFVTGKIIPTSGPDFSEGITRENDIVIVDGSIANLTLVEALEKMKPGDIIFKGANILNYDKGQSGICIGAADGGTVARLRPFVGQGKGTWITPVGLEKDCSVDLFEYSEMLANAKRRPGTTLLDATTDSKIYTEIEAIKEFADVDVYLVAKGGLAGAEGGVSLIICGQEAQVAKAMEAVESVMGEAAFAASEK